MKAIVGASAVDGGSPPRVWGQLTGLTDGDPVARFTPTRVGTMPFWNGHATIGRLLGSTVPTSIRVTPGKLSKLFDAYTNFFLAAASPGCFNQQMTM